MNKWNCAEACAKQLQARIKTPPNILLILGSGLGRYAQRIETPLIIPYNGIEGFPLSTVPGHKGEFVFGTLFGREVAIMNGRSHLYEGHKAEDVALPVRALAMLGLKTLILTNAAGGINPAFTPGDIMIITDHLNLTGQNPLAGENEEQYGPRFPDMSGVYDPFLINKAGEIDAGLKKGIYAGLLGPSFETPAEIRMLRIMGADAVGMSTVTEAIAARHMGLRVLGLSCITNLAAGVTENPLNHEEVLEAGKTAAPRFAALLDGIIGQI
ncbi:MAG: purine-nucleoside phosphorylase [Clostridia bacterium]|nr:purine-nucleoside phosphorylase [Clostridia bacterium]